MSLGYILSLNAKCAQSYARNARSKSRKTPHVFFVGTCGCSADQCTTGLPSHLKHTVHVSLWKGLYTVAKGFWESAVMGSFRNEFCRIIKSSKGNVFGLGKFFSCHFKSNCMAKPPTRSSFSSLLICAVFMCPYFHGDHLFSI